jgi:hypothetical protein
MLVVHFDDAKDVEAKAKLIILDKDGLPAAPHVDPAAAIAAG